MILFRRFLYFLYLTKYNVERYKKYRNLLNKIIKNTQRDYYKNLIKQHNNNCTGLWKTLGNIICNRKRETKINKLSVNNKILNDPIQIANTMNNYFTNIGLDLAKKFENCTDKR